MRKKIQEMRKIRDMIFELAAIAANNGLVKLSIRIYIKGSPDLPCEDKSGTWHGAVSAPVPGYYIGFQFYDLGSFSQS